MNSVENEVPSKATLQEVWSHKSYAKYKDAQWNWWHLPFSEQLCVKRITFSDLKSKIENKSILELGSAMGQAYQFMKSSGLVDVARYSGIEVSRMGFEASKERFPEANWIHTDFTRYSLDQNYDYSFERHAIHHMENPLAQFRKVIEKTNDTFQTLFRGRVTGETISNLELGHFVSEQGWIYLNVINLFDVIEMGLRAGFNHIGILYCGKHEPISSDRDATIFLNQEIQHSGSSLCRFAVRMVRCGKNHHPSINVDVKFWKDAWSFPLFELRAATARFVKKL